MPTPQNLPALIKEMQERAREIIKLNRKCCCKYGNILTCNICLQNQSVAVFLVTDTANATLEYVKGVAEELPGFPIYNELKGEDTVYIRKADLIARLTNKDNWNEDMEHNNALFDTSNPE
jgi:hypothetical protein